MLKKTDEKSYRKTPTAKCNIGKTGDHPDSAEDESRQKYYAVLDTVIPCIKDRFMQDDYAMFSTLEQLVLKAAHGKELEEEFKKITQSYKDDFDIELL